MATEDIAAKPAAGKPVTIYGLVDPITNEIRYVGKTVATPQHRLTVHLAEEGRSLRKRKVLAWFAGLRSAGERPQIIVLEVVQPGCNWTEAEQFWIAYFRFIGARLCNLTTGGDGACGCVQSEESKRKRADKVKGPMHPNWGRPISPHIREAMAEGRRRKEQDPEWRAWVNARRQAGHTDETRAAARELMRSPEFREKGRAARLRAVRAPESRERVSRLSRENWERDRDGIIAAQNAGKGDEFRRKQSEVRKALWAVPEYRRQTSLAHACKLSSEDVLVIRQRLAAGESQKVIAKFFGVDSSMISSIKTRRRWSHL